MPIVKEGESTKFIEFENQILKEVAEAKTVAAAREKIDGIDQSLMDQETWLINIRNGSKHKNEILTTSELEENTQLVDKLIGSVKVNDMVLYKDSIGLEFLKEAKKPKTAKQKEKAAAAKQEKINMLAIGFLSLTSTRSNVIKAVDDAIDVQAEKPVAKAASNGVIVLKNVRFRTAGPVMNPDTFEPVMQFVIRVDLEFKLIG